MYSFSDVYDSYESIGGNNINKSLLLDLEEFYAKGYINNASLHSPIDIDCFAIDIPENSEFEYLELSVNDNGGNTCEIQVYQDVTGYQHMQLLSFGSKVKLTANAGRYYIRMVPINTFDLSKITNYEFSMNKLYPAKDANKIAVTSYDSAKGPNSYQYFAIDGTHYYCEKYLDIYGYAYKEDPDTGKIAMVSGAEVTAEYTNNAWSSSSNLRLQTGKGTVNEEGGFYIKIALGPAVGINSHSGMAGTSYFDLCDLKVFLTENRSLSFSDRIYQKAYFIIY